MLDPSQVALGAACGCLVGLMLGSIGGGGSILALPMMVYIVGVQSPHVAIGTSALAVAANAGVNLIAHARLHPVKWRCALIYAGAGVAGALAGSALGKQVDGQHLLFLFAIMMLVVSALMFRDRRRAGDAGAECNRENAPKVVGYGVGTGVVSGFFGIGGGFLVVPGLIASTGMPILNAIGCSLVAIAAFGIATALNYAASGWIDWPLAAIFIAGGVVGGAAGVRVASRLSQRAGLLKSIFAIALFSVAGYMLCHTFHLV